MTNSQIAIRELIDLIARIKSAVHYPKVALLEDLQKLLQKLEAGNET